MHVNTAGSCASLAKCLLFVSQIGLFVGCTSSGTSLGLAGDRSQQMRPETRTVHGQPGTAATQWVFDARRGRFTRAANDIGAGNIYSLLMPKQASDGSVSGVSSLYPLTVVELSAATLGDVVQTHTDVSSMTSIAACPTHVADASFQLSPTGSHIPAQSTLMGSRISEHYTWAVTGADWGIQSAHCLRDQPTAWEDTAAIRANLREFTNDEAWLDVLVGRVQSLQQHGVASLESPKLAKWQIDAFLNNPKYVPSSEIRQVFESILPQIKVHSWESFVFHLSAAWQQFLSTVAPNDRIVIMRRLKLKDPTYSGNHLSREAEIKSDDWVYGLIRAWTGQPYNVFDYARTPGYEGQWDGDTLISLFTLRKWAKSRSFKGNVRFVYVDDWMLSGNLAWGPLSHAANFAQFTDAFKMDVVTAFQSDDLYHLNYYMESWPYRHKVTIHEADGVSTRIIPTLGSVTTQEQRALLDIDWMGPYSIGVLPYHLGDMLNNVYFRQDSAGVLHYTSPPSGLKFVTLFKLLELRVAEPPYR